MIASFKNQGTEDIFNGVRSRSARRTSPEVIWKVVRRKLAQINAVTRLDSLTVPPGNRLESLKGDRAGQHSIRINDQYRICFRWTGTDAVDVEITDYH